MDDKMTVNAMRLLSYAPAVFLFNGYWMLSNRQIFENIINHVSSQNDEMSSSHGWSTVGHFDQATPMLFLAMACLILITMRVLFFETLLSWGFTISTSVIEVDENLPNFYYAVKLSDADWLVKESTYLKDKYHFSFAD